MYKFAIALLVSAFCCSAAPIIGPLATGNILDWDLTVSDPAATVTSFQLLGPLESGTNSQVGVSGSDLTETSSQLFFNFSGSDNGWLLFQAATLFDGKTFWCSQNSPFNASHPMQSCSDAAVAGESLSSTMGDNESESLSGDLVIASGGTASGADIIYNVNQSWTTGSHVFSVTGTVTTGPVAAAVPEPSAVGLLGLGMAVMGFWKFRASRSS